MSRAPWLLVLLLTVPMAGLPARAEPIPGQPAEAKTAGNRLLDALKAATSEHEAAMLEAGLLNVWLDAASPAARLLATRGMRDLQAGATGEAIDDFDAMVVLEPALPEPWHQRAIARFRAGDSDGAVADIEQTLQREPRHFAAFGLLSHIAEARGNWRGAYEAWQKLLELDPMTPGGQDRLKMLRQKALGQDL
jgi:tetratricopeptide (TPR) repeat protein